MMDREWAELRNFSEAHPLQNLQLLKYHCYLKQLPVLLDLKLSLKPVGCDQNVSFVGNKMELANR